MIPALAFAAVAALANSNFAERILLGDAADEAQVSRNNVQEAAAVEVNPKSGRSLAMEALNAAPKALAA